MYEQAKATISSHHIIASRESFEDTALKVTANGGIIKLGKKASS
jgi:hypothetical protein